MMAGCRQEVIGMDFDKERDFEMVTRLISEVVDIGEVTQIEEINRFTEEIVLGVTVQSGNVYRVNLSINDDGTLSIWTISSQHAKIGDRGDVYRAYQKSFDIIQEATGFSNYFASTIAQKLIDLNIGEITRAKLLEPSEEYIETTLLELECENNYIYHLWTADSPDSIKITNISTGEVIYEIFPSQIIR